MFEKVSISPQSQAVPVTAVEGIGYKEAVKSELYYPDSQRLPLQRKSSAAQGSDDPLEHEAQSIASKALVMPELSFAQRKCAHCEEEENINRKPLASFIQKKVNDGSTAASPAISEQVKSTKGGGSQLNETTRSFMENRFGADFSNVRFHTGDYAVRMSKELNAQAFTVGSDIYFNAGKYAPEDQVGKHLLAHELTHVIQQSGGSRPTLQKQDDNKTPAPPVIPVPGTSLTLMPGPLKKGLLGTNLLLPGSLSLTNALGMGAGPSYILRLSPEMFMLHLLQNIDLQTSSADGTPPEGAVSPENTQRVSLINPTVTFNTAGRKLSGSAVLSIPTGYPLALKGPTLVDVQISSTELGMFTGKLGYGPLNADMTLKLHYNTPRLEKALAPVLAPAGGFGGALTQLLAILNTTAPGGNYTSLSDGLQSFVTALQGGKIDTIQFVVQVMNLVRDSIPSGADVSSLRLAITQFANEISHPGFTLTGGLNLGFLPLTRFSAEAPTTVPLERPLTGAPTAYPLRYSAYGAVIAPKGSLFDTAVPAVGYTYSNFGEKSGTSFTSALLPSLSLSAISEGKPVVERFPVYAYISYSRVQKVSKDVDLGIRFTVQVSTGQLFGGGKSPAETSVTDAIGQYQDAAQNRNQPNAAPNVGATVFGTF